MDHQDKQDLKGQEVCDECPAKRNINELDRGFSQQEFLSLEVASTFHI